MTYTFHREVPLRILVRSDAVGCKNVLTKEFQLFPGALAGLERLASVGRQQLHEVHLVTPYDGAKTKWIDVFKLPEHLEYEWVDRPKGPKREPTNSPRIHRGIGVDQLSDFCKELKPDVVVTNRGVVQSLLDGIPVVVAFCQSANPEKGLATNWFGLNSIPTVIDVLIGAT